MAAPAVRIAVVDLALRHQCAALLQQLDDGCVGLVHVQVVILGQAVAQAPGFVHIAHLAQRVLSAGREVVRTVRGRGVNAARALFGGDVLGHDAENLSRQERMREGDALQLLTSETRNDFVSRQAGRSLQRLQQFLRDDVDVAFAPGSFSSTMRNRDVLERRVKGDCQRCGQRPRRGGPDQAERRADRSTLHRCSRSVKSARTARRPRAMCASRTRPPPRRARSCRACTSTRAADPCRRNPSRKNA